MLPISFKLLSVPFSRFITLGELGPEYMILTNVGFDSFPQSALGVGRGLPRLFKFLCEAFHVRLELTSLLTKIFGCGIALRCHGLDLFSQLFQLGL